MKIVTVDVKTANMRLALLDVVDMAGKPGLAINTGGGDVLAVAFVGDSQRASVLSKLARDAGGDVPHLARNAAVREIIDFLDEWMARGTGPISLHALVGDNDERTLGDAIRDAVDKR